LTGLAMFSGPLSMVLLLSSLLIIRHYPLDQAEHTKITNGIRAAETAA